MTVTTALVLGFYAGLAVGYWLNRKPPVIKDAKIEDKLVIDPKLLHQIDAEMVNTWLNDRGMMWQPRGVADPYRSVKK